jgi:hypothetical protein
MGPCPGKALKASGSRAYSTLSQLSRLQTICNDDTVKFLSVVCYQALYSAPDPLIWFLLSLSLFMYRHPNVAADPRAAEEAPINIFYYEAHAWKKRVLLGSLNSQMTKSRTDEKSSR